MIKKRLARDVPATVINICHDLSGPRPSRMMCSRRVGLDWNIVIIVLSASIADCATWVAVAITSLEHKQTENTPKSPREPSEKTTILVDPKHVTTNGLFTKLCCCAVLLDSILHSKPPLPAFRLSARM